MSLDISPSRSSERHKAMECIQLILDAAPLACFVLDKQSLASPYCNMEAVRLFGFSSKEEFVAGSAEIIPMLQPDGDNSSDILKLKIHEAEEAGGATFKFLFSRADREPLPAELTIKNITHYESSMLFLYVRDLRAVEKTRSDLKMHSTLLQAVNIMATNLIDSGPYTFEDAINKSLMIMGRAVRADRTYIWENYEKNGTLFCRQIHEWCDRVEPQQGKDFTIALCYDDLPLWKESVFTNKAINGPVRLIPNDTERSILQEQGIKSVLILPLYIHGRPWGFIGFDDCHAERTFDRAMEQVLESGGILLVFSIMRNQTTLRLINTGSELRRHEKLLSAVNEAAKLLLETDQDNFMDIVQQTLEILGICMVVDRVSIWRDIADENNESKEGVRLAMWDKNRKTDGAPTPLVINYDSMLPGWRENRRDLNGPLIEEDKRLRNTPLLKGYKSLLLLPLSIHGHNWGFIAFTHKRKEYTFNDTEKNILRSGGMLIASAIIRNEMIESLVEAREMALKSARAKSEFLSRMSHEIRTPMNAIIGMTALALKSGDMEKVNRYLESVDSSSRQLLAIINDVLDMSKIDADKLEILHNPFDFEGMIRHVINVLQVKFNEKKINFHLSMPRVFSRAILSDELRLSQVLLNLLSNAVKFTPDYGDIGLTIREMPVDGDNSKLVFEVSDSGIGISPEFKSIIFQSFEQGDNGISRQYGGTGLGLAITKRIVELMGGRVYVESRLGHGSVFTVEICAQWGGYLYGESQPLSINTGLQILVADSDPLSCEYVKAIIKNFGLKCDIAASFNEAMCMAQERTSRLKPYDILFIDWSLLKDSDTARETMRVMLNTAVIMISTYDIIDINSTPEESITHYLIKPIMSSDLYNMLIRLNNSAFPGIGAADGGTAGECRWNGKHILLAEDIDINREIVAGLLEDTGIIIDNAENGQKAVDMYTSDPEKYKLIFMDVQMPILDGLSAARQIRASGLPGCDTVPIIAMTANAFKEDEQTSMDAGMNGHIAKPFDVDEILQELKKALG